MTVSVLTIARGRDAHLRNVVLGLSQQKRLPDELVVGVMQDMPYDLPDAPFPIRQTTVAGDPIPLARARNTVAREARGDKLLFVDVDCIPEPGFVAEYAAYLDDFDGLVMGEVLYLPKGEAADGWTFARLAEVGEKHGDRRGPPPQGLANCNDYRCFWSLNFALSAANFDRSGGFDEAYAGYGAEDTDFGRTLDAKGIPIAWCKGARVYHQYHPHHMPPVHHLRSILRNTDVFRAKWGHNTMNHWIRTFRLMGLIDRNEDGSFTILREPNEDDYALTRQQEHQSYASSVHVLAILESAAQTNAPAQEIEAAE